MSQLTVCCKMFGPAFFSLLENGFWRLGTEVRYRCMLQIAVQRSLSPGLLRAALAFLPLTYYPVRLRRSFLFSSHSSFVAFFRADLCEHKDNSVALFLTSSRTSRWQQQPFRPPAPVPLELTQPTTKETSPTNPPQPAAPPPRALPPKSPPQLHLLLLSPRMTLKKDPRALLPPPTPHPAPEVHLPPHSLLGPHHQTAVSPPGSKSLPPSSSSSTPGVSSTPSAFSRPTTSLLVPSSNRPVPSPLPTSAGSAPSSLSWFFSAV